MNKLLGKHVFIALTFGLLGAIFAISISLYKEAGDLKINLLFLDVLLSMIAGLVTYRLLKKTSINYLSNFIIALSIYIILISFFIGYMCIYDNFLENDFYPLGILIYIAIGLMLSLLMAIPFKRRVKLSAAILLIACGFCQAQPNPYKATSAQTAALKKQAEASASALNKQDYKQMAYYTYPKIIEAMGGADKMQEKLSQSMAQMQSMGIVIKSVSIGNIDPIIKSKGDLYSVVQSIIQIANGGSVITSSSYLLAYSHNNGLRWYFVDGAPLRKQNVKQLFPTYPDGLVLPQTKNPFGGGK